MEGGKITQTEWARELGVSKQYVCCLVKKGIVELEDGLIDREQANEAVAAIRDPSQPLRRKNPEGEEVGNNKLSMMLLKTRIKNEMERGRLLEAKAKAEIGELISVEEVKTEAFNVARVVRNNLLNIPDRVSALLASINDTEKIHYPANNVAKNVKLEKSISRKLLCPKTRVPFIYSANNQLTISFNE